MNKSLWQKLWPHLLAVAIFLIVAIVYCQPALQGKVLNQHDTQGWKGMAQQSFEYKEKYGHFPYWTNSMFSGMPGYQIAFETPNKFSIGYLHNYIFTLGLPKPINFFFLACLMAYYLMMVLRVKPWIGILGALAYAYSTFDPIIISVGHDTQMIVIGYAPSVIASLLLLLWHRKYILGTVSLALFAAMMLWQNHIQISYYTTITAFALAVAFFIDSIRKKDTKHALTCAGLALIAGAVAIGVNTINIWPMNEYQKETMRGGRSELTDTTNAKNKTTGGLDKDYAFHYGSYGIAETFTFVVPAMYGGGSAGQELKAGSSKFAEKLTEVGMPEETAIQYANAYSYWGNQPAHGGPVYLGAIICFLFLTSLVFVKGWIKWGLLAATIFAILLSFGKNLEGLNYFLYDFLPMYKKFRAPSMSLVIPQMTFVMLACMSLQEILFNSPDKVEAWKKFKKSLYITGGVVAVLGFMYFTSDYRGPNDTALKDNFVGSMLQQASQGQQPSPQVQQQAEEFGRSMLNSLHDDRQGLFGKDLLRSLLFILAAAAMLYLYLKNKLKAEYAMIGIIVLGSFDVLAVGKRYMGNDKFVEPADFESAFNPTPAVQKIKADPDKNFRVFDQASGDPFQSSVASYHFNDIGGYSPVKLALYQDIITRQLSRGNMNVFNMLNTKYFIVQNQATGQPDAQQNPNALGNVWFVKGFSLAKNADDEMRILDNLNTRDSAVVDERFKNIVGNQPQFDSTARIVMKENLNDRIVYESKSSTPQFAVFSEIYYPHGWDAYIDGRKAEYARVNYVLRGMPVPAGNHSIEFRFEPRSVILGDKITMWLSILIHIMLVGGLYLEFRKSKTASPAKA